MSRTVRIALSSTGLCVVLCLGLAPASAEKPLSSPAQLAATATHVVRGEVVRVFTHTRQQGGYRVTAYVAEVKVAAVEKGEGIRLDRPLHARYWTQAWTGPGDMPPGTGGHSPLPEAGAAVRVYLARNAYDGFGTERHDGGYDVVGVNGWQLLTPAEVRAAEAEAAPRTVLAFPRSWMGVWEGELRIAKPAGGEPELSKMVFVLAPTDDPTRYDLRLRYGDQPLRRYQLVVRDAATGQYAIDEKNGVVLPATYLDGELFSYFSLGGTLMLARYRLDGDFLRYDLTSTGLVPAVETGGESSAEVGGHYIQVVQRALLKR